MQKENRAIIKNNQNVQALLKRIERLEKVVFSGEQKVHTPKGGKFEGATGGIRFLISKGYLNTKKSLSDIKKGLEGNNYHYSIQAAQTALNRLSKTGGRPLVALKEGGKKVYVKRK